MITPKTKPVPTASMVERAEVVALHFEERPTNFLIGVVAQALADIDAEAYERGRADELRELNQVVGDICENCYMCLDVLRSSEYEICASCLETKIVTSKFAAMRAVLLAAKIVDKVTRVLPCLPSIEMLHAFDRLSDALAAYDTLINPK